MPVKIALIGGGHAHVVALRQLAQQVAHDLDIILISSKPETAYSGLLPAHIAGHVERGVVEIDLPRVCRNVGATFIEGTATALDPNNGTVQLASGDSISFDIASLDIGATSARPNYIEHRLLTPVKPMEPFMDRWNNFIGAFQSSENAPVVAVIGGGAGGVELALSIHFRLTQEHSGAQTHLFQRGPDILPNAVSNLRRILKNELKTAGVQLHINADVALDNLPNLRTPAGEQIAADFVALTTGVKPYAWLADTGLALHNGFICVDHDLRSTSHPNIFATGDTAHFVDEPLPKAGVYAVRQGKTLMANLLALKTSDPLTPYEPQSDYLKLISLGRKKAIAEKWGFAVAAPGLWTLKRSIDLAFTRAD